MSKQKLPLLAFGEAGAARSVSPKDAAEQSSATLSSLRKYEAKATDFKSKISNLSLNGLALHANSSGPVRCEMIPTDGLFFIMTLYGVCHTEIEGQKYQVVPNQRALLLSEREVRYGESETRSVFVARLDAARLQATAGAMRGGQEQRTPELDGSPARSIELKMGSTNLATSMRSVFGLIDSHLGDPVVLSNLGVDDLFYRQIALMIWPEEFLSQEIAPSGRSLSAVEVLCEAVRTRLERPLTMTEMEKISGLSGRTLQYAFNRRFGCTPMEWQRRERLHIAQKLLSRNDGPVNIADLAAQLGFSSPSRFARYYQQMFGVRPSGRQR
jgi:AraC-like DNA-binding protein